MKQKLFLLMVLMVGLVACSKDEDDSDNLQIDIYKSDNLNNLGMGEFVGDWILNNKKIETDTLTVLEQTFFVKSPSESLLRYAVNTIPNVIDEMRFEVSNTIHGLYYELQGYSENKAYSNLYNLDESFSSSSDYNLYDAFSSSPYITPTVYSVASGIMYFNIGDDEEISDGYYSVLTDKPMLAIFYKDTCLWTLKITLNKLSIIKEGDEIIIDLSSPIELLFVTTKKIKDIKPE